MDKKDAEKLERLEGAGFDLIGITAEENYVFGFRDGAKMILDILHGESDDLC